MLPWPRKYRISVMAFSFSLVATFASVVAGCGNAESGAEVESESELNAAKVVRARESAFVVRDGILYRIDLEEGALYAGPAAPSSEDKLLGHLPAEIVRPLDDRTTIAATQSELVIHAVSSNSRGGPRGWFHIPRAGGAFEPLTSADPAWPTGSGSLGREGNGNPIAFVIAGEDDAIYAHFATTHPFPVKGGTLWRQGAKESGFTFLYEHTQNMNGVEWTPAEVKAGVKDGLGDLDKAPIIVSPSEIYGFDRTVGVFRLDSVANKVEWLLRPSSGIQDFDFRYSVAIDETNVYLLTSTFSYLYQDSNVSIVSVPRTGGPATTLFSGKEEASNVRGPFIVDDRNVYFGVDDWKGIEASWVRWLPKSGGTPKTLFERTKANGYGFIYTPRTFQSDGEFVYFNDYQDPGHLPNGTDQLSIIRRIARP